MNNESFYLTVNSNTPNPTGGENKPQQFTVKTLVDQPLIGEWEVGLTSFRYPNSWYNVQKNLIITIRYGVDIRNTEDFTNRDNAIEGDSESGQSQTIYKNIRFAPNPPASTQGSQNQEQPSPFNIPDDTPQSEITSSSSSNPTNLPSRQQSVANLPSGQQSVAKQYSNLMVERFGIPAGNYDSIESIVTTLNKMQNKLIFSFNPITKRVSIHPFKTYQERSITILIGANEMLMNLLGFKYDTEDTTITIERSPVVAAHEASLSLHFPAIYLYSDVVKHQFVNGMMAQLLFDDTITGEKSEYTERRIGSKDAMYLTVGKNYINQLKFEIRADTGDLIPFQGGKVQIRLHFRPKHI